MNATSHSVSIGTLDASAAEAAIPELAEILRDSVASGASVGFMNWNTAADLERFWRDVVPGVASGQVTLLAARNNDGIVGTAQLHLIEKPNQPHRAEIAKVLVHSRARRQGIGEALMQRAEAIAREKGRDLLVLDTDEHSAAAALYPPRLDRGRHHPALCTDAGWRRLRLDVFL